MTTRPIMMVNGLDLDLGTTEALSVLVEANNPPALFLLGDTPVRIESHPDDGRPITRELTETRVVYHLAQAIEFRRATKDGTRPAWPPVTLARNILAAPSLPLPAIERIVEVPVLGRDGSICATPGYHAGARVFYKPVAGFWVPTIPADPTDNQIEQARTLICDDLLGDFPFVGAAERAHAVALMALPLVRDLIDGPTPLHVIEKPMAGTGATLLADVLMRPALGRPLPAMTAGRDGDEWRKRLTAALTESPTAILWDNASRLDSDELAAALTAITWQDRPMGGSRLVRLPVRCCWIATANNPALNVEIVRRTVRIRLDAGTDRPWMRDGFRHPDLAGWTQAHRGDLVAAVLTLARAWIARGRPAGPPRHLGTYESWSKVLGGILHTAGIPGFLANVETFYETMPDDELRAWHGLVDAWWRVHRNAKVGVRDIWDLIQAESIDLDLGDKSEKSQRTRLGKLLGRMRDRIFDGRRVQNAGTDGRAAVQLYRLVEAQRADVADVRGGDDDQPPSADVADFADVFPLARTEN